MAMINYITQIQMDFGALQLLKSECERVGINHPLIVTDAGVKAVGILDKALAALPGLTVSVFDQTPSNPTETAVRAAAAIYKQNGCDGLIALGGGSSIDCAKGVAIAATHEGPLKTYATIEGGSLKITDRVAPLIAVPTTAGRNMAFNVPWCKRGFTPPRLWLRLCTQPRPFWKAIAPCMLALIMFRRASRS